MKPSVNSTTIAPEYVSGFIHLFKECVLGFAALTALFLLLSIPGRQIIPAEVYCTIESNTYPPPCTRPYLFAFEGVCATVFVIMTYVSIKSWHVDKHPQKTLPQTAVGRVYGYSSQSEKMAALSFVFQFWSIVATPFIPEFYSNIMMGHHIMAATVSFLALHYQYYHYYVVFFLALTEVSSVPLVIMSLGKYFPHTFFGSLVPIAQPLFALSFSYYRVYLWNKVSYGLWSDAITVLKRNNSKGGSTCIAEDYRPGKTYCLYLILLIDVILGLLQLFWFAKIIIEILKLFDIEFIDFEQGY